MANGLIQKNDRPQKRKNFKILIAILLPLLFAMPSYSADVKIGANLEVLLNGKPFFPVGCWLEPVSNIKALKEIGFDVFVGAGAEKASVKEYLNECAKQGVYCTPCFEDAGGKEGDLAEIKNHPALFMWMQDAEPDNVAVDRSGKGLGHPSSLPEKLAGQYKIFKKIDPERPVVIHFGPYYAMGTPQIRKSYYPEYEKAGDVFGFDVYPCANITPDKIYYYKKTLQALKKLTKGEKMVFAEMECNSIAHANLNGRAPTPEEMRQEFWMNITNGAHMIMFFLHSWQPVYSPFYVPPQNLEMMKKLIKQIKELAPVVLSADSKTEVTVENRTETDVNTLVKDGNKKLYIFASNGKNKPGDVEFTEKGTADGDIEVYDEGRTLKLINGKFTDKFKEFDAHIYIILKYK